MRSRATAFVQGRKHHPPEDIYTSINRRKDQRNYGSIVTEPNNAEARSVI